MLYAVIQSANHVAAGQCITLCKSIASYHTLARAMKTNKQMTKKMSSEHGNALLVRVVREE